MDAVISGIVHMDNIAAENSVIQPDNAKTRQATRYGVRLFREYCVQHGVDTINNLPPREIAAMLKGFYGQARTKDGQRFSVNSLIAIRYAISRYYRSPMVHRKIDIVKDSAFNDANETFRAVLKDLERESRGTACQKELQMVDMDDRRKLRHYFEHAISTPRGLLQKVWYDLMLRVGRRGRESQRLLNRNSFRIAKTADGRQYIYQVDDEEAGIILEIPGDPLCPVKTLKFYLGRLNPACRALFQRPKEHIYEQDTCWYVNSPVGKNMLATMMSTISKCARLSRIYTNVRIRATTYSPADGKGCIPCTDVPELPVREQDIRQEAKPPEKRPPEIAPKPVQVMQNSHIIKQLNAPIVQACLSVAVSNTLSPVTNAGSFINRVFPIALTSVPKQELLNGQAINIAKPMVEESPPRSCDFCKKELKGGMVLKSSEAGKEYCSTECLGKWLAAEHKELQALPQGENAEKTPSNNNSQADSSSNPKIQKLLTLCSSANLLIPFPSLCKDFTASENEVVTNGDIKDESRSSSPQLIVPDEVYPEAILETVDSDPENLDAAVEESEAEEVVEKLTCDQEVMCQPTMISCAISCKPILKSQGIQTDFSTYFSDSIFRNNSFYPKYIVSSTCCSKDEEVDDVIEEHSVLDGDTYECFDDAQDTNSLWMSVEECDDDEPEVSEYISPVSALEKCEETLIPEPLTSVYSQRGRTTKRTTWDEIAQRSKLQTLWGVKVFREWLQSRGSRRDFERLEAVALAGILEEFYENLTKPDGEEYSVSTMHTIRASISRYLTLPPQSKPFSIIRDREFKRANEAFYRRIRRLQSPRQPPAFHYATGRTTVWQPQTVNIPCSSNGIMLVQLGPQ
ncbi:TRASH domain-containing protein [Caerostris darwini]|uniref:TRASH domain-containing protein n=1 Tax=Caerostris darwini TaxID=1538125 RepID=A0AAV4R6V8_9ARAC|nr:TRASH domain-containing protein [Caerostris darwini]